MVSPPISQFKEIKQEYLECAFIYLFIYLVVYKGDGLEFKFSTRALTTSLWR